MTHIEKTVSIERKSEKEYEVITSQAGVSLLSVFSGTLGECKKVAHGFWRVGYHKTGKYLLKMPKFKLGGKNEKKNLD